MKNQLKIDIFKAFFCVFFIFVVLALAGFSFFSQTTTRKGEGMHKAGELSDALQVVVSEQQWLNTRRPLKASELKNRIVLLDFWTFCCINCLHVLPKLAELEKEFGQTLTVIGVHSGKFANEKGDNAIRQAILRYDVRHPVVNDKDFAIWNAFNVSSWPTLILINPSGNIERVYSGEGNQQAIRADVQRLIQKHGDTVDRTPLPIELEKEKEPEAFLRYPSKILYVPSFQGRPALFIADTGHNRILGVWMDGTVFTTIGSGKRGSKDGAFQAVSFSHPGGMVFDTGTLYIADTANHLIRAANFETKKVTTLAGTGKRGSHVLLSSASAETTDLASPWDLEWYPAFPHMTIAMAGTHQLWSLDVQTKKPEIIAGSGRESIDDGRLPGNSLSQPSGLSRHGDTLYFVDSETSSLRTLREGSITTYVGTGLFDFGLKDGVGRDAQMQHSLGVHATEQGVYVADTYNHALRVFNAGTLQLTTVCGNGQQGSQLGSLANTRFDEPSDVVVLGAQLFVADSNNHRIVSIDLNKKTSKEFEFRVDQMEEMTLATDLPNLQTVGPFTLVPLDGRIELVLKSGWKINTMASSWMKIWQDGTNPQIVATFDNTQINDAVVELPKLEHGSKYRVQATIYYCEKTERPACLLKSYDFELNVAEDGKKAIKLTLNE